MIKSIAVDPSSINPVWFISSKGQVSISCPACKESRSINSRGGKLLRFGICVVCRQRRWILNSFMEAVYGHMGVQSDPEFNG